MGMLLGIIGGGRGAIILVALLALGGWEAWRTHVISSLRSDNEVVTSERDRLRAEKVLAQQSLDQALVTNSANQQALAALVKEKQDAAAAMQALEADRKRTITVMTNLSASVRSAATNPANQVAISPVLRDTIAGIQKQRETRAREDGSLP